MSIIISNKYSIFPNRYSGIFKYPWNVKGERGRNVIFSDENRTVERDTKELKRERGHACGNLLFQPNYVEYRISIH